MVIFNSYVKLPEGISNMDLEDVSWQNSHIINQSVPECARVPCIQNHAISIYIETCRDGLAKWGDLKITQLIDLSLMR